MIRRGFAIALFCPCSGALACQRVPDDAPVEDPRQADARQADSRGQVQRYVFGTTDGQELSSR